METQAAFGLILSLAHAQLKIRPRIRLFSKFIVILALAFVFSSAAVSYIKPREAEIKINGLTILVAEDKGQDKQELQLEISQSVTLRRSPFELVRPLEGYLSQGYSFYHRANDIAASFGTPIHPLGPGIVEFAGFLADGKGNVVIVDHGDGLKSLYAHMAKINVGVGNVVNPGTTIGTVGLTGRTTGPHVHLEIFDNGFMVDPQSILP